MCVIGCIGKNKIYKASFLFIITFFIHNSVALFFPVLFSFYKNGKYIFLSYLTILINAMLLVYITDLFGDLFYRYDTSLGDMISYLYLISLIFIFILFLYFEYILKFKNKLILNIIILSIFIYLNSVFLFDSLISQRIILFIYSILFPIIAFYFEYNFRYKKIVRLIFLHLSLVPLFILFNETINTSL